MTTPFGSFPFDAAGVDSVAHPQCVQPLPLRAPTTNDIYPVGTTWCDAAVTPRVLYISLGGGEWDILGSGASGPILTITGNSGGAESPTLGGNFNILGTANQVTVSGSANTETISLIGPYTPATYTAHGVLVGEGTSSIVATTPGTDGQVLTGNTGADPSFQAIGTKSGLTAHGVILGEGASAFAATAVGADGTVLTGNTGADPTFQAVGAKSGLTAHGVVIAEGTSAFAATAVGATGTLLAGVTGADPAFTASPSVTGSVTAGTTLTATLGNITATNGNLALNTAGNKIVIATGTNASVGTSPVMSGTPGAITVATTASSATAKIFYARNVAGGTLGEVSITAQDGTGFTLTSTDNETSTFNWWIINA